MKKVSFFLIFTFVLSTTFCYAQQITPFKKGDRVVFVGNSITHNGRYHADIWLYYMTHFPNAPITVFNAGIGGEIGEQMFKRLETDVYAKSPSVICITFGMNDTGYSEFLLSDSTKETQKRLKNSYKALLQIDSSFKKHPNVEKILIAGSPYDETSKFSKDNIFTGKSKAMLQIADYMKTVAQKSGWGYVDFTTSMTEINLREQKKDSNYTLIGNDRVHPGIDGHLVMAYLFLKDQGLANEKVADFTLISGSAHAESLDNCDVDNIQWKREGLRFDYLAKSLPYPIDTIPTGEWWAMQRRESAALDLVPFTKEFNEEMMRIRGLKGKKYIVEIDGQKIGEWSGAELDKGINLAEMRKTPQYEQAMVIKKLNEERWQIECKLRDYAWMEYDFLMEKGLLMKDDLATLDTIYAHIDKGFVRGNLVTYLNARYPQVRKVWQKQMDVLVDEIYYINKPVKRSFYIYEP